MLAGEPLAVLHVLVGAHEEPELHDVMPDPPQDLLLNTNNFVNTVDKHRSFCFLSLHNTSCDYALLPTKHCF